MPDDVFAQIWERRHRVLFMLGVSYSYHRKRQRFFDLVDKYTKAATVLAGATLLGDMVKGYSPLAGAVVSGLGLLSLVFGYGDRKQLHKELAEAFMELHAAIDAVGPDAFTAQHVCTWEASMAQLNRREPPALRALVTICQNEQAVATGHPECIHRLPLYQRMFASWLSFSGVRA